MALSGSPSTIQRPPEVGIPPNPGCRDAVSPIGDAHQGGGEGLGSRASGSLESHAPQAFCSGKGGLLCADARQPQGLEG
jgi:hypothetical protein